MLFPSPGRSQARNTGPTCALTLRPRTARSGSAALACSIEHGLRVHVTEHTDTDTVEDRRLRFARLGGADHGRTKITYAHEHREFDGVIVSFARFTQNLTTSIDLVDLAAPY